jgi:hypothetical protein
MVAATDGPVTYGAQKKVNGDIEMSFSNISSFLPVTVISAIILFAVKELLEYIKRKRADDRKRSAIRTMILNECKKNNSIIRILWFAFKNVQNASSEGDFRFNVKKDEAGEYYFEYSNKRSLSASFILLELENSALDKYIIDIATVDKRIFRSALLANDNLQILADTRRSIIGIKHHPQYLSNSIIEGYLINLSNTYDAISRLYLECSGKNLEDPRVGEVRTIDENLSYWS